MIELKYEYKRIGAGCVVPCLELKQGEWGEIAQVSLYDYGDYVRAFPARPGICLRENHSDSGESMLAKFGDSDLRRLVDLIGTLDELMQLRRLERELEQSTPDYRVPRWKQH